MTIQKILYNHQVEKFLSKEKIFLNWRDASPRSIPATLMIEDTDVIEPYVGFYSGDSLCTMGSFSYSHSKVIPGMRIGRYCSISWSMVVTGPRHPYEWLTTSNITYDKNASNIKRYIGNPPGN